MKNVFVFGCGRLGGIIASAIADGKVPEVRLVGVCDQNVECAERLAKKVNCIYVDNVSGMMQFQPDVVVEAAGDMALSGAAGIVLEGNADLITLSAGAFGDPDFEHRVREIAKKSGKHVYLASGVVGGFDLMQAAYMMGNLKASFVKRKLPVSSGQGDPALRTLPDHYQACVREGYALYPQHLNVAVAVALATGGLESMDVIVEPGDSVNFTTVLEGDFGKAEIYSELKTQGPDLAAWSAVALLKRITSPISF